MDNKLTPAAIDFTKSIIFQQLKKLGWSDVEVDYTPATVSKTDIFTFCLGGEVVAELSGWTNILTNTDHYDPHSPTDSYLGALCGASLEDALEQIWIVIMQAKLAED